MRVRALGNRGEAGASAVEFALIMPFLCMILLGTVTVGFAYNESLGLASAVREGARFGATSVNDASWGDNVRAHTADLAFGSAGTGDICVQLVKVGTGVIGSSPSGCGLASPAPATPASAASGDCVVKVWAERQVTINIVLAVWHPMLEKHAVAKYERPC